jgi:hypothetical protein
MTQKQMTRWIEAAEARRACEAALFERVTSRRWNNTGVLHAAFVTMHSAIHTFVADHRLGKLCDATRRASSVSLG